MRRFRFWPAFWNAIHWGLLLYGGIYAWRMYLDAWAALGMELISVNDDLARSIMRAMPF